MPTSTSVATPGSAVARWVSHSIRPAIGAALIVLCAAPASAMTVVYGWTPDSGQLGSGSLTISDPGIVDAANFSAIPVGALISLSYTWANGASMTLASVVTNNAPSWTACAGYMITGFQITASTSGGFPGTYSLSNSAGSCYPNFPTPGTTTVVPGPGSNGTNSVHFGAESNAGHWTLSSTVVPVPGAVWLLGSALAGLLGLRRRQTR